MKVTVLVRLKSEVLDPQGDAVRRALGKLGFEGVRTVRVGKLIEMDIDAVDNDAASLGMKDRLAKMADEMLANPVIEDYEIIS
ncbi:MAG: phosphoribosylformylglycinamidine synthase subunit PurS [Polyangiaceae bacterium]|nr:phosphoribosylformylglycinamidine synthase subunit PurS [Polyangiaceae bacterium]